MFHRRGNSGQIDIQALDAFFEALNHYTDLDLMRMSAAWRAVGAQDHEDAWTAVRTIGARDGFSKEIDKVRRRALDWASRGTDVYPYSLEDSIAWAQVKRDSAEAIVDVALAMALGGRLDEKTRETLLASWDGRLPDAE
jgi:hypothetical protein